MYRAIIVEDEAKGLANLQSALNQHCPDIEVVATATNIAEAKELFQDSDFTVDVAFLDISLPDGMVFSLLDALRPVSFEIIFVTAYDKFAKQACDYASIGFITKPLHAEELVAAVSRIRPHTDAKTEERLDVFREAYFHPNSFRKLAISALDGVYFVELTEIVRLEAEDNYTHIFLKNGSKITASKTIKAYEGRLKELNFYRVHKRHVINMNFMQKFVKGDGGYLVMDDGMKIEVSRRRRPAFMEQMRRLEGGF